MSDINPIRKQKKHDIEAIKTISDYHTYADSLKISPEQRTILDMIFVSGWSYRLIADELGYTESTIKVKVRKILDFI